MQHNLEILLVEDDPNDVELALHAFRAHQLANAVRVARDGAEALSMLFDSGEPARPKVILLDLKLPKIDGIEVLRRIKGNPATRTIPVVVLTSSREERDVIESYHLGVNSYIVKPIDFERFAGAVQQLGAYWLLLNQPPS
jgi:CheY-like chemotaxis protein